jgi:hypothetical protein
VTPPHFFLSTGPRPLAREREAAVAGGELDDARDPMDALGDGTTLDTACRELEQALRSRLCVTAVVIRVHTRGADLVYGTADAQSSGGPRGAKVTLMIRDAFGIVGDIDVIDGCHPTCGGRAIHAMAKIVEEHADAVRRALARETSGVPV